MSIAMCECVGVCVWGGGGLKYNLTLPGTTTFKYKVW